MTGATEQPIVLHLDRSTPEHLFFEEGGVRVNQERAFVEGFAVRADDAAAILTRTMEVLLAREVVSK